MADWITPYSNLHHQCLSIGQAPSQGLVYAVDEDIVVKIPFQYRVTDAKDCEAEVRRDDGLRSFELLRKEAGIYRFLTQHPHPNIVRCLYSHPATCLFLERAKYPLELAQAPANKQLRHRWVRQLMSAVTWLEGLGYTHGDLAVQNIGVDSNDCLKLFDFGASTSKTHHAFNHVAEKDRTGLATCIHFILSGVDPIASARDWEEVRHIKGELSGGRYPIAPEARDLGRIILDGWTGRSKARTFAEIRNEVEKIIGLGDDDVPCPLARKDFSALEAACVAWLETATVEPDWVAEDDYRAKWRALGYGVEEGIWEDA